MNQTFQQRRFFEKRKYVITATGVDVEYDSFNKSSKTSLNFDEIGFGQTIISNSNKYLIAGMCFALFGSFVVLSNYHKPHTDSPAQNLLFYVALFTVCAVGFAITKKKIFILSNFENKPGIGFLTDPEKDKRLSDFLKELKIRRDAFLMENYGQINKNLPYQQVFNNLMWLRDSGVITEEERKKKVEELDRAVNTTSKVVGFSQRN